MHRTQLFLGSALVVILSGAAFAQSKTVTNADLEKYRVQRLAAEKDLNENYEELGFPSPEELERQEQKSRSEYAALARRLREEEARQPQNDSFVTYYQTAPTAYPYPNPSFVDYGGRYAPSYLYYRFYNPGYRYPVHRGRTEPRRFQTFRRQWRNAVRQNGRN